MKCPNVKNVQNFAATVSLINGHIVKGFTYFLNNLSDN